MSVVCSGLVSSTHENTPQPLIRWAGSKRKMLPHLIGAVPSRFSRYYEPFFGSGCLFFAIQPEAAVLGDINKELIKFYRTASRSPLAVLRAARQIPRSPASYYRVRSAFGHETRALRRAAFFLFLNRCCFNGIYRTNRSGVFNVPYGTRTGSFPSESAFGDSIRLLRRARFIHGDFELTLAKAGRGDFVYIDPPYVYSDRRDRGEYGAASFSVADIGRLRSVVDALDRRGARFLLSYLSCPEAGELAHGFKIKTVSISRCISGLTAARKSVDELLVQNY